MLAASCQSQLLLEHCCLAALRLACAALHISVCFCWPAYSRESVHWTVPPFRQVCNFQTVTNSSIRQVCNFKPVTNRTEGAQPQSVRVPNLALPFHPSTTEHNSCFTMHFTTTSGHTRKTSTCCNSAPSKTLTTQPHRRITTGAHRLML
jgi:hypothetical protein